MGEQLSKTHNQKQSTDCSSASSLGSQLDKTQLEPISCSPEKLKQISKSKKIKTTCVLKSPSKSHKALSVYQHIQDSLQFDHILSQISLKLKTENLLNTQSLKKTQLVIQNIQSSQIDYKNPDLDRINGLFVYSKNNLNLNQFHSTFISNSAQIQRWKASVNKIMKKISLTHHYTQGQLLICAIMRLYFTEDITYAFLGKLLLKIGKILCISESYNTFSQKLSKQCAQKFQLLNKKLQQKDIDFQFLYTGWLLGMFSDIFTNETCIMIWFSICMVQAPQNLIKNLVLECISQIQVSLQNKLEENQEDLQIVKNQTQGQEGIKKMQLTSESIRELIKNTKIQKKNKQKLSEQC